MAPRNINHRRTRGPKICDIREIARHKIFPLGKFHKNRENGRTGWEGVVVGGGGGGGGWGVITDLSNFTYDNGLMPFYVRQ